MSPRIFRRKTMFSPDLPDDPYLVRWTLFKCRWFEVLLHRFLRSDSAAIHDHPWSFVSLVLWRGYREFLKPFDPPDFAPLGAKWPLRRRPLSIAFRRAEDRHRVEIDGPPWTLVVTGPRRRSWFFYPSGVRVPWRATCRALAEFVAKNPGCTMKAAIGGIKHHYKRDSTALSSMARWINKDKVDGVYRRGETPGLWPVEAKS